VVHADAVLAACRLSGLSALEAHYAGVVELSQSLCVRGGIMRKNSRFERFAYRRAAAMICGVFVSLMPGDGSLTLSAIDDLSDRT
jgi:hypothetical protein